MPTDLSGQTRPNPPSIGALEPGLELYWVVTPTEQADYSNNPTGAAQIAAGLAATGAALPFGQYGSQAFYSAAGATTVDAVVTASGLTSGTQYRIAWTIWDGYEYGGATGSTYVVISDIFTTLGDAPPSRQTGGGKSRKSRRRRLQVEIDGEVFDVDSEAEAEALLAEVARKAEATAQLAIERAAKARMRPVRKIVRDAEKALSLPSITVSDDLQAYADQMLQKIRAEYQSALSAIEIAALMAKKDREIEEDDEDILMLL